MDERLLTTVLNNLGPVDIRMSDAILSGTIKAYKHSASSVSVRLECDFHKFLANHTT